MTWGIRGGEVGKGEVAEGEMEEGVMDCQKKAGIALKFQLSQKHIGGCFKPCQC